MKTSCYTYFAIKGNFNPDEVSELLSLTPSKSWCIGDKRKNGKSCYEFALWEYGRNNNYRVDVKSQCLETILDLKPRIEILKKIKYKNDVSFVLEIVPSIYVDETYPAICFDKEIIGFCYLTETYIDIDMYVF